jgi:hypothetical protein
VMDGPQRLPFPYRTGCPDGCCPVPTLIKKKIKFSSYTMKFRVEQLQSIDEEGLPNI